MNQHSHFYKALQHSKFQSGIRLHTKSNFNMQRFFSICFCILHILLRGLFPLLTKLASNLMTTFWPLQAVKLQSFWFFRWDLAGVFGSNVPQVVLKHSCKFQEYPITRKKIVNQIYNQICKTWTKWAVHSCAHAGTQVLDSHFVKIEISWGFTVGIMQIGPTVAE